MKKYNICVYAICKNEEQFVERWVESMSEANTIVVTDTGSTDKTVEKLRELGVTVYTEKIEPWRFDTARNISLSHIPEEVDICVCTDLDEIFLPNWRECLENAWDMVDAADSAKRGEYVYNWSLKPDGMPDVQFNCSKIHGRKNFCWQYPVHECLRYTGAVPVRSVFIDGMTLNHYPDSSKSRGSYLALLETAVAESPQDSRMTHYLGREYMYAGRWQECISTLKRHLSLFSSQWKEERCASMRWIAEAYFRMGEKKEAYSWYSKAIAEMPDMRDAYIEFAKTAFQYGDWSIVLSLVEEALKIKNKSASYINMGYSWDSTPYDLCAVACFHLNLFERALLYGLLGREKCTSV